jgi:hypothetical protein
LAAPVPEALRELVREAGFEIQASSTSDMEMEETVHLTHSDGRFTSRPLTVGEAAKLMKDWLGLPG